MKKLGFGCMRLPMKENEVDYNEFNKMIDLFIEEGFTYFDTAHGYIQGKSEIALRECLVKRYPRNKYTITDKLTGSYFNSEQEIRPFFQHQLECVGVSYFDYYLMHSQDQETYKKFKACNAYSVALDLKKEGLIKHFGISFHDTADCLELILKENPLIEFVQIQFNYKDYDDASVQAKKVYDVARKYDKKILIMEPVKGGGLVNLPIECQQIFDKLADNLSYASYAIRFAASFEGVVEVLSGMSNLEQMKDNLSYMKNFKPLTKEEFSAIFKVVEILNTLGGIPCTTCRYCIDGCPKKISIPDLFSCYNAKKVFNDWNSNFYYSIHTKNNGKASDCIKCGKCENICPQHLEIRKLLEDVVRVFEKKENE